MIRKVEKTVLDALEIEYYNDGRDGNPKGLMVVHVLKAPEPVLRKLVEMLRLNDDRDALNEHEKALVHQGQAIKAIKAMRERTGRGLKECKDAVDRYKSSIEFLRF